MFYNLRLEIVAHLEKLKVWVLETMEIIDSGAKGTMFLSTGEEIYYFFKVDVNHKDGSSHYFKPAHQSFSYPWAITKEEVEGIMMRAMAKVSLLERQVERQVVDVSE